MKVYQKSTEEVKEIIEKKDINQLYEKASQGLMELSVSLGLEVLQMMLEENVEQYAGPRGKHNTPERTGYRHGIEDTTVVMGGQKVRVKRPRVRAADGSGELPLESLSQFQNEDPLNKSILAKLLNGVSTRKYERTLDMETTDTVGTSKSSVSRRFIDGMDTIMEEFFNRKIKGDYPVIMIDGTEIGKMTIIAAMGIDNNGKKFILGITGGGTENSEAVKGLFSDLIERGLDANAPRLYVLDGGKALHKAVNDVFGKSAIIQRCQVHKKRNVLSYLPESEQANVSIKMSLAYREFDYEPAKKKLNELAVSLENRYPKAAASLLEGLEETLTVNKLKVPGMLRETLLSTNPIESANSVCRGIIRRVSNFKNGATALRYAAAGFMEAEHGFRRIKGYRQLPFLNEILSKHISQLSETVTA